MKWNLTIPPAALYNRSHLGAYIAQPHKGRLYPFYELLKKTNDTKGSFLDRCVKAAAHPVEGQPDPAQHSVFAAQ